MEELEAIAAAPSPARVEPEERPPRRVRRRLLAWGGVAVTAAAIAWSVFESGGSPTVEERLAAVQEFVRSASSVRFEGSHEIASPYAGTAPTYRTAGALRFPALARRVSHGGGWPDEETIRVPEGRYVRSPGPGQRLREARWEFIPDARTSSRRWAVEGPDGRPSFGELLSGLGPPLDAEPDRADLREVLAGLEGAREAGEDAIRARLPLAKLFRDSRFAEAMLDGTGSVEVRLTSGPGGRLDRMTWELDARRLDAPAGVRCNVPPGPASYGPAVCVRERAEITFTAWNRPVDVAAPSVGEVDTTPGIEEERLAIAPAALAEADLVRALASLAPLDLATQPVYQSIPPQY